MKMNILILAVLMITIVSFSQWTEQTISPQPPELNCVSANVGGYEGWIGGNSGTILYTSNGGTNWNYRVNSVIGNRNIDVISVFPGLFLSSVNGKALCSATSSNVTYIFRTSNYGVDWSVVYQRSNGRIRSIFMIDTSNGVAVGDPIDNWWTILKTTNSGITFDSLWHVLPQNGNELSNFNCMFYSTVPSLFFFGTNNSRFYKSTNNGLNWTFQSLPFQNIYCVQLAKYPSGNQANQFGYAAGNGAASSTDYGATWNPVTLPGTGDIHTFYTEIDYVQYVGYACYAKGQQIYSTSNYTQPFTLQYTSPNGGNYTQISLSVIQFEGGSRGGWGVKDNGTVSRYYISWGSVKKINNEVPEKYFLSQNYLNPFNPNTNIKFQIAKSSDVKLIVFDVLGREIATLVNEKLQPGTYETEWDGSNYSSGVYFYKLITLGYTVTRKMVLVK